MASEQEMPKREIIVTPEDVARIQKIPRKNSYYSPDEDENKGLFEQTVHGWAEAFTAHGVHYIFERGTSCGSKLFWILVVILFLIFASIS